MKKDNLGDRMKEYEDIYDYKLIKKIPVIIRLDGRAFHTFTKGLEKPFDLNLIDAFHLSVLNLLPGIQGRKLAYHQSDEVSILITDYDTIETQGFFDYRVNKINSVVSSAMTNNFNYYFSTVKTGAQFDCRCFNIPEQDIANYFLRRQRDRTRNSIQMLARYVYSHKELKGKKIEDIHEMLYKKGINWSNLEGRLKNGTYFTKRGPQENVLPSFEVISELVDKSLNFIPY